MIGALLVISSFLILEPQYLNLFSAKAYAEEKPYLKSIYLSDGDNIEFSKYIHTYIVDVDKDIDQILIKPKPDSLSNEIKINGQATDKENNYKQIVDLNEGKNKIEIEVKDDRTNVSSLYTIYVYRGGNDAALYLNYISINGSNIGFDESNKFYNIELDEGTDLVRLETTPEEGNYVITANGKVLNETNSIKLKFNGIGKYTISIEVQDKDTQRKVSYTINIYLGIPVSPNVSDSINAILKPNQWIIVNGRWRYNDSLGNCLKSAWFYDNKYKSYFHFNSRGNMQTGWIEDDGNWYYLGENGFMQTGWIFYENQWYYLDTNGVMRTGWTLDNNKWYRLRRDGTMETGWIIDNNKWYYLNFHGIMQTGWIYYGREWYYLNSDGVMQTGWLNCNDEWYYLNADGSMKSGEWLYSRGNWYYINYAGNMRRGWLYKDDKYYYFNEDGSMRTSSKTIDGYTYYFNENGSVNFNY